MNGPVPSTIQWAAASFLVVGAVLVSGGWEQQLPRLRTPLDAAIPNDLEGYHGTDVEIPPAERDVAGFTDYLLRQYDAPDLEGGDPKWFSVYVGYYATQTSGRTIHSPKNCLPGAGWEALESQRVGVPTPNGEIQVNRYVLQQNSDRALVLYWYQGRGRVVAGEYRAKLDLLRDAALRRRSEEALVRIVVPILGTEEDAFQLALRVAERLEPAVAEAMPLL